MLVARFGIFMIKWSIVFLFSCFMLSHALYVSEPILLYMPNDVISSYMVDGFIYIQLAK